MRGRGWTGALVSRPPVLRQIVRGWCVFIPIGNSIRDSHNISSVTDNGAGDMTFTWAIPFGYAAGATGYAPALMCRGTGQLLNAYLDSSPTIGNMYNVNFLRARSTVVGGGATEASVYCMMAYGA